MAWLAEEYPVDSLVLGPATLAHLEEAVDVLWKRGTGLRVVDELLKRLEALREDWFGEPGVALLRSTDPTAPYPTPTASFFCVVFESQTKACHTRS